MESEDNFKIGDQDFGECSMLSVHATYVSIRATCKMIASEKLVRMVSRRGLNSFYILFFQKLQFVLCFFKSTQEQIVVIYIF